MRKQILAARFETWRTLLCELEKSAEPDHTVVRFPNSSTYLFSTGKETFWMMDPAFSRPGGDPEELRQIAALIREKISFIVLTHLHADHCQFELVQRLADSKIRWIVPAVCAEDFLTRTGWKKEKIRILREGESCGEAGIRMTAGPGFHGEPGRQKQVPSASYTMVLPDGIRLFFPGDVRDFRTVPPARDPVDFTFGHVFLGREDATGNDFSLLDDFCRFMTARKTDTLILAHLYDAGRQPEDLWTFRHAALIRDRIGTSDPEMRVRIPRFGDRISLMCPPSGLKN